MNFICNVLKHGALKEKYLTVLTSNIALYEQAATAKSVNPNTNYEVFEQFGDLVINKFIVNYAYDRFACDVKTAARIRIKYASKIFLAHIAETLGFKNFIRADQLDTHPTDLLEDTFEAFFGCTEHILDRAFGRGVGYAACYSILKECMYLKVEGRESRVNVESRE